MSERSTSSVIMVTWSRRWETGDSRFWESRVHAARASVSPFGLRLNQMDVGLVKFGPSWTSPCVRWFANHMVCEHFNRLVDEAEPTVTAEVVRQLLSC